MAGKTRSYADLINNVVQSGEQFTQSAMGAIQAHIEYQAKIDSMNFKNALAQEQNSLIAELDRTGDITQWQGILDEYKGRLQDSLGEKNSENPFYARNAYTNRMFQNELNEHFNQLQSMVTQKTLAAEHEHNRIAITKNIESARNNPDVTEGLTSAYQSLTVGYQNGDYTEEQRQQLYDQEVSLGIVRSVEDTYMELIKKNPNMNEDELIKQAGIEGRNKVFKSADVTSRTGLSVDDQDRATKVGIKQAQEKIAQVQNANNDQLMAENTKILENIHMGYGTPAQQTAQIKAQIAKIKSYDNASLSGAQSRQRQSELWGMLDMVQNYSQLTGGSASTGQKVLSLQAIRSLIDKSSKEQISKIIAKDNPNNTGGLYDATHAFLANYNDLIAESIADMRRKGYSEEAIAKEYNAYIATAYNDIVEQAKKGGYLPEDLEAEIKQFGKDNKLSVKDLNWMNEFAHDFLFDRDLDKMTAEQLRSVLDDYKDKYIGNKIDYLTMDEDGKFWGEGDTWSEKDLYTALMPAEDDNMVFTDTKGQLRWANPEYEKAYWEGPANSVMRTALVDSLNKKFGKDIITHQMLCQAWEPDKTGHDLNARLNFTIASDDPELNGKVYRFVPMGNKVFIQMKNRDEPWEKVTADNIMSLVKKNSFVPLELNQNKGNQRKSEQQAKAKEEYDNAEKARQNAERRNFNSKTNEQLENEGHYNDPITRRAKLEAQSRYKITEIPPEKPKSGVRIEENKQPPMAEWQGDTSQPKYTRKRQ